MHESRFDVTDEPAVVAAFAALDEQGIAIDIPVNNAGIQYRKPMLELATADWQRVIDTNLTSAFHRKGSGAAHGAGGPWQDHHHRLADQRPGPGHGLGRVIVQFGWDELLFLVGTLRWTLLLTVLAFLFGSLGGGLLALLRLSPRRPIRLSASVAIELVQSIPVLMILFLAYFGMSAAGLDAPPLVAAALSLGIWSAAYLADIWRSAVEAVPFQQWEASASLALSGPEQYRYIILAQAIRIALPPTIGLLVQLVKNTSIVSVVGIVEVMRAGQFINSATFDPFRVFAVVGLLYFMICFPLSYTGRRLEVVFNAGRRH